ncbi:hypothetical protein Vafri_274 [Volvox africanus]|nr:hypothetical protein Vafri_274 [Volvox africanus]
MSYRPQRYLRLDCLPQEFSMVRYEDADADRGLWGKGEALCEGAGFGLPVFGQASGGLPHSIRNICYVCTTPVLSREVYWPTYVSTQRTCDFKPQVYSAYAASLRHSALQHYSQELLLAAADTAGGAVGGGDQQSAAAAAAAAAGLQAALTRAVAGLRRAAGVYGYLADEVLPALRDVMAAATASRDWPLELLPAAARCMQHLSLAEAQALVAAMAELKGMSPGTQRALHAGCVLLFRDAAAAAQELAAAAPLGLPLSDRLLVRFLPAATALHAARSQLCFAREQQAVMEMGQAEAACEEAIRLLASAAGCLDKRLDPASWLELIQAEQATCSALLSAVHRDRLAITFQPLPKQPPDALANPAIRVVPDAFQPEVVIPPVRAS